MKVYVRTPAMSTCSLQVQQFLLTVAEVNLPYNPPRYEVEVYLMVKTLAGTCQLVF